MTGQMSMIGVAKVSSIPHRVYALSPHFLFEGGLNRRMIGPTPVFMLV
jgi:hypothetical protein